MIKKELTELQKKVFDCIFEYFSKNQRMPTYDEIGNKVEISKQAAYDTVGAIEKKGYLGIDRGISRGIRLSNIKIVLERYPQTADTKKLSL